jgi:hypothetical protein
VKIGIIKRKLLPENLGLTKRDILPPEDEIYTGGIFRPPHRM